MPILFSAHGVKAIIGALVPRFEGATGRRLTVSFGEAGELRHRILDGEAFDLAVLPAAMQAELVKLGRIAGDSVVDIARTGIGIGVRTGGNKPDTGSAEAFARSLLAAGSIAITDPASGGVSGVHFSDVLQRLGIADAIASRLRLTRGALNAEWVARGGAELAVQLAHEIHAVDGVEFVPLPAEFQRSITFSAGIAAGARRHDSEAKRGAREFVAYLSGREAASTIIAQGMEPATGR
jgi:molybdate transport system substrate-binding protein